MVAICSYAFIFNCKVPAVDVCMSMPVVQVLWLSVHESFELYGIQHQNAAILNWPL